MAKSFIDVAQDSPRTGLGIPVKTKKKPSLEPIHRPWNRLSGLNITGGEQLLQDSMVIKSTCLDRSCIKQLQIYHARHEPSLSFPGSTNVGHEPS